MSMIRHGQYPEFRLSRLSIAGLLSLLFLISPLSSQDSSPPSPDFDGNGTVDFPDFLLLAIAFGSQAGQEKYESKYDLDGDGEIGMPDFLLFARVFGQTVNRDIDEPTATVPSSVAVENGDGKLTVRWDAVPDEVGKPPVTGYEVGYRERDSDVSSMDSNEWAGVESVSSRLDTSVTITGLLNGQAYQVSARTLVDGGVSEWSPPVLGIPVIPAAGPTLPEAEAGDLPAATTTPGVVAVDGSVTGTIGTVGDVDWFAVTLADDTTYIIDVLGSRSDRGTLDHPLLRGIYDATGAPVTSELRPGRVLFSPRADGKYFLAASGAGESTGSYTLTVAASADIPADTSTTARVYMDNGRWGYIETPGDTDWFEVTLEAGTSYRIDLKGLDFELGELVDTKLISIRDSNGAVVANAEADGGGLGQDARFDFVPDTSGTYYIEAGGANGSTGFFVVSVNADDYAADRAAGVVTLQDGSGVVTGTIERAYDADWFKVTLERGTSYWIDLEGAATDAGTLKETKLSIILPEDETYGGLTHFAGNGEGGNSRFQFTAQSDGPYYLAVRAEQDGTGTYTLSVRAQTESTDVPADATTTAEIAVGDGFQGTIDEEGDTDWIGIQLVAGTTYTLTLIGSQSISIDSGQTLADPRIVSVRDDAGVEIGGLAQSARQTYLASGQGIELTFTATRTGLHYIEAGAGSGTGSYRLSVRTDDYAANTATAGEVMVGASISGIVETAYERDWFAVTLEAGTAYRFDLEGAAIVGTRALADPYLRGIYDATGTRQAGTDDDDSGAGNSSRATFTPTTSGTYYVAASGDGVRTGAYTLSVSSTGGDSGTDTNTDTDTNTGTDINTEPQDDYGRNNPGSVSVGGAATGVIETTDDEDRFAVTLQAGRTYRMEAKGADTEDGTLDNPRLYLLHYEGPLLFPGGQDDDSGTGRNASLTYTPTADGTVYLVVSGGGGTYGPTGSYRVTVADITPTVQTETSRQPQVTISAGTTPVTEGTAATFTITASSSPATALTVNVDVSETGDVISGTPSSTVTINANATTATLTVNTVNDQANESNSVVTAKLQGRTGYTVASSSSASVTVEDNDNPPPPRPSPPPPPPPTPQVTISAGTTPVTEGTAATFTIAVSPAQTTALAVNVKVTETEDVISGTPASTVTINANATTATLTVATDDDDADESNSVVTAEVETETGYTVGSSSSASVTVNDNDDPPPGTPEVTISAGTTPVTEGTAATFTITVSPAQTNSTDSGREGDRGWRRHQWHTGFDRHRQRQRDHRHADDQYRR